MNESMLPKEAQPAVNEDLGVISIACDCVREIFRYDTDIGDKLLGRFDDRSLWDILQYDNGAKKDDIAALRTLVLRAQANSDVQREKLLLPLTTARGKAHFFCACVSAECGKAGQTGQCNLLLIDVTKEFESSRRVQLCDERDNLTGLLLRNVFLSRVRKLVESAPPGTYVMVYFDISKFSVINERYGYEKGDAFLRFVARTIEKTCGEDCLCCRVNADCFAVCIENERLRVEWFVKSYRQVMQAEQAPFEVGISFGLCVINDPTLSPDIILDRAMLAQRSIKGSYITRYAYYDDALRRIRLHRQGIESEMDSALRQGQFDVYVQPQFSLATGKLIGGETLARWFHPERGIIMPGEFIPIFEQNGFIRELDTFVWERACKLLKKWTADGGDQGLSLSVNISRVNLLGMDVSEKLRVLTSQYGISPEMLRLEVTESAYADNPRQLIEVVEQLQKNGFTVEMDDFGSGYSSLNTLKDVPVNALKLDLRFLTDDIVSGRGGSIINSVIRMARWLQLPVTAEGVETQQQADYLHSVGCDYVQGYLYGRPMPVAEFESLLQEHSRGRYDEAAAHVDMADANAFWNPDSQETLIFNSYVGGAAIMEYSEGHVELLRANKKFRAMMRMDNIGRYLFVLEKVMFPEDHIRFIEMLDAAILSDEETTCTTRQHDAKKGGESCFWLRNRVRVLCKSRSYTIFYLAIEDITAEREAQQRYHISQDTLMAAAAHTHLQYWTYNMVENTSVQGIEAANNDSGLPKYIENYPQTLFDLGFIHPDFVDVYRKLHTDLKEGARTVSADVLTGGEGHWEWRKIRYTVVPDEDGVVRSAIGTSESLSAYKELEQRFMIAVQQCGLLTWVLDLKKRSIHTEMLAKNGIMQERNIENMPEQFVEMGLVHPEDTEKFIEVYNRMFAGAGKAVADVRCQAVNGGGDWRYYRLTFTAVADKDGRTGSAVCTGMDVTEQVNMQMRYREALAYYEGLDPREYIRTLHANVTTGTVKDQDGSVRPYMETLHQLTQYIEDDEERVPIEQAFLPETLLREYEKGMSRFVFEYRTRLADGTVRWVRTNVRLLMDTGKQELCVFIYTKDINDEKMKTLVLERIVLEDYDFVTIIDTEHDTYKLFIKDADDTFIPSEEKYTFSDASEIFALTTAAPDDAHRYIRETRIPYMLRRLTEEGGYSFLYHAMQSDGSARRKRISLRMIDERTRHVCLTRLDIEKLSEVEQ